MPTDVVVPDEIIAPDGEAVAWDEPGCPVCGNAWAAGPERARWGRQHCWKCGYAPGQHIQQMPGAPVQPDWAKLVQDAVTNALRSEPQVLAVAMTAALGQQGMADLARKQQEELGMAADVAKKPGS